MDQYFELLKQSPLFRGIAPVDYHALLQCLGAYSKAYEKNACIILAGDRVKAFGMVLQGSVNITREDFSGNSQLLAHLSPPDCFAEVFACAEIAESPVSVLAAERCTMLFLPYGRFIAPCSAACAFHTALIKNMLRLMANRTLFLQQKIDILSKRTIRERLLLFLQLQCGTGNRCTLQMNREELARFLCVDRSALSNELSKLQRDGILRVQKNQFELL